MDTNTTTPATLAPAAAHVLDLVVRHLDDDAVSNLQVAANSWGGFDLTATGDDTILIRFTRDDNEWTVRALTFNGLDQGHMVFSGRFAAPSYVADAVTNLI